MAKKTSTRSKKSTTKPSGLKKRFLRLLLALLISSGGLYGTIAGGLLNSLDRFEPFRIVHRWVDQSFEGARRVVAPRKSAPSGSRYPTFRLRYAEDAQLSQYDNLLYGIPAMTDTVLDRIGYALGYSEEYEQPLWVAYHLTPEEANNPAAERSDDFRPDPHVPTGSATPADYRGSGFDRGHLAPAADMAWSDSAMWESFYLSNMSPQRPEFNRGIWKDLESQVRQWARDRHDLYIVTGPYFTGRPNRIGPNKVAVPAGYYKVIFDLSAPGGRMIGFLLPNRESTHSPRAFAVTVDEVEAVTGLDFFAALPPELQRELERTIEPERWSWQKR